MARVPINLQQYPEQELARGSDVQFSPGSVEPQKDVVSDDITRQAKAMSEASEILKKIDDDFNDAEAKRLSNAFYSDLDAISSEYMLKQGWEAVQPVKDEETGEITQFEGVVGTPFDDANAKIEALLTDYQGRASNGVVKYMFENMAQGNIRNHQQRMTEHSYKQTRKVLAEERKLELGNILTSAVNNVKDWSDPEGTFNTYRIAGLDLIEQTAREQNLRTEEGPNGEPVSPIYKNMVSEFNMKLHEAVVEN